jgi:dipeptidyl-peptidase-3
MSLQKSDNYASDKSPGNTENIDEWQWEVDRFADIKVLRYKVPGWENLPLKDKKLAYYLIEAGRAGFDIIFDQNYKHNLVIRKALLAIWKSHSIHSIDRTKPEWDHLETYIKQVFFSNGIHHHYSHDKFIPLFSKEYFKLCLQQSNVQLTEEVLDAIFDPKLDTKKVEQNEEVDVIQNSCVNFYGPGITRDEVTAFYEKDIDPNDPTPIAHGLNSKLSKVNGKLIEERYHLNGLYGSAISKIIDNLTEAKKYAEPNMANGLTLLIEYFTTGDLKKWDEYCIHWVSEGSEGENLVDYILGFIEVYNDPLGKKGSFESVVQIVDLDATQKMRVLQENAQYFEDHSPTFSQHKRKNVTGITFKFINTASNGGDNAPASSIGINLPNSNWIRSKYGSKSINLGNISHASDMASGNLLVDEFSYSDEEKERDRLYCSLADTLHTALHEVIGHGSGQIEPGVSEHALEVYSSTIEEGRADLVALYYLMDPKMVEIGLMPSLDLGKQSYDDYIKNGLIIQLRRIKLGERIEEAHMRNRHWISAWVYEKGQDTVIQKVTKNGKTYFVIKDYEKLRTLFGELLKEVQRIKSQGDLAAAKALVENYGVFPDPNLHKEVLDRCSKLNRAAYTGYVQATYKLVFDEDGEIIDIIHNKNKVDFMEQMVYFCQKYNYLK